MTLYAAMVAALLLQDSPEKEGPAPVSLKWEPRPAENFILEWTYEETRYLERGKIADRNRRGEEWTDTRNVVAQVQPRKRGVISYFGVWPTKVSWNHETKRWKVLLEFASGKDPKTQIMAKPKQKQERDHALRLAEQKKEDMLRQISGDFVLHAARRLPDNRDLASSYHIWRGGNVGRNSASLFAPLFLLPQAPLKGVREDDAWREPIKDRAPVALHFDIAEIELKVDSIDKDKVRVQGSASERISDAGSKTGNRLRGSTEVEHAFEFSREGFLLLSSEKIHHEYQSTSLKKTRDLEILKTDVKQELKIKRD